MGEPPETWLDMANNALVGYLEGLKEKSGGLVDEQLDELLRRLHMVERNAQAAIRTTCNIQLDRVGIVASIREELMDGRRAGVPHDRMLRFVQAILAGHAIDANPVWVARKLGV